MIVLLALLATTAACNRIRVRDDVDLTFDFAPLIGPSNLLHQPYVQGASMGIYIDSVDNKQNLDGWTALSADPTIFTVDSATILRVDANTFRINAHAVAPGTASLEVLDDKGKVQHKTNVVVEVPDRIELLAHGPMLVNRDELDPKTTEPIVLDTGTATFLVRYYNHDHLLYGNGALSVDAPDMVTISTPRTYLFEDRDWLQLTPTAVGDFQIPLKLGGIVTNTVKLHAVDPTDVASLHIYGESESHASTGEWLVALAQSFDSGGKPIYGVDYHWDVDGTEANGEGDLYRYEYNPKKTKSLTAKFESQSATATIHGENGFVDSSNHVGCSAVPGVPIHFGTLWWLTLAVAFVCLHRRRHA